VSPPTTGLASTAPATTATTNPAAATQRAAPKLEPGSTGPAVLALQQRLSALHYWLGTPDGTFGDSTEQAVYAFQKAAGVVRDGVVGPKTEAALSQAVEPQPRSRSGYVIEIDLSDDLMMFVTNGTLDYVLNTSTGGGYTYTTDGETAVADTPVGVFHISRQVDGLVTDSLGQLWRPKFFYSGFAIHGDGYVPPYPVSHGCARVSNEAIDWIWATGQAPIGTEVWVF
jgi:peptidoglycan hydrolase-like protein with peptidoglycan-binding domain